jgi:hypothetical protein
MLRKALIITLCLAVAILGVSGMHVHVPGPLASGQAHVHEADIGNAIDQHVHDGVGVDVNHHADDGHAYAISALHGDHDADHGEHGDIDIEPIAKAFSKLSLNQLIPAVALIGFLIVLLSRTTAMRVARRPSDQPPRRRFLPYFLPPSHAPPAAALLR